MHETRNVLVTGNRNVLLYPLLQKIGVGSQARLEVQVFLHVAARPNVIENCCSYLQRHATAFYNGFVAAIIVAILVLEAFFGKRVRLFCFFAATLL